MNRQQDHPRGRRKRWSTYWKLLQNTLVDTMVPNGFAMEKSSTHSMFALGKVAADALGLTVLVLLVNGCVKLVIRSMLPI